MAKGGRLTGISVFEQFPDAPPLLTPLARSAYLRAAVRAPSQGTDLKSGNLASIRLQTCISLRWVNCAVGTLLATNAKCKAELRVGFLIAGPFS